MLQRNSSTTAHIILVAAEKLRVTSDADRRRHTLRDTRSARARADAGGAFLCPPRGVPRLRQASAALACWLRQLHWLAGEILSRRRAQHWIPPASNQHLLTTAPWNPPPTPTLTTATSITTASVFAGSQHAKRPLVHGEGCLRPAPCRLPTSTHQSGAQPVSLLHIRTPGLHHHTSISKNCCRPPSDINAPSFMLALHAVNLHRRQSGRKSAADRTAGG